MSSYQIELIEKHTSFRGEQCYYRDMAEPLGRHIELAIYLPESVLADNYCSVLYYLPGIHSSAREAAGLSDYQRYANRYDMILVIPDIFAGYEGTLNTRLLRYEQEKAAIETYITQSLPEVIEHHFRVYEARSIMGYGFGGSVALNLGMRFSQLFRGMSAFAPWVGFHDSPLYNDLFTDNTPEASIDPLYVLNHEAEQILPTWIDLGSEDSLNGKLIHMDTFEQALTEHKQGNHVSLHERARYDHSYYFVASHVRAHFVFHAEHHDDEA